MQTLKHGMLFKSECFMGDSRGRGSSDRYRVPWVRIQLTPDYERQAGLLENMSRALRLAGANDSCFLRAVWGNTPDRPKNGAS